MKKAISILMLMTLMCSMTYSLIGSARASIYSGISTGMWFKYRVSLVVTPSYGIFQFSFDETYKLTITGISNNTITYSKTEESGTMPVNSSQLFDVMNMTLILPTNVLANHSLTIGNESIAFPTSIETDASVFWRGIPIKSLDLSSVFSSSLFSIMTTRQAFMKFDNKTGLLYETYISASINLAIINSNMQFDVFLMLKMTDASSDYKTIMSQNYDSSLNPSFIWYDIYTSPWFVIAIVSIVVVSLIFILSIRHQRRSTPKKQIQTKAPKKRSQQLKDVSERHRRAKSNASKK